MCGDVTADRARCSLRRSLTFMAGASSVSASFYSYKQTNKQINTFLGNISFHYHYFYLIKFKEKKEKKGGGVGGDTAVEGTTVLRRFRTTGTFSIYFVFQLFEEGGSKPLSYFVCLHCRDSSTHGGYRVAFCGTCKLFLSSYFGVGASPSTRGTASDTSVRV